MPEVLRGGEREKNPISFLTKLVCAYEDVKASLYPIKHFWCGNDDPPGVFP